MTPDVLERERPYLMGVAYRMLGSAADAEDVVQEALARGAAIDDARTPRALLTTIVTRLCLDELRSARRQREAYVGPWLPEPVVTADGPDDQIADAESVSIGFLLLLESLTPHERAVFVLREVLDLDFDEIGAAVERTEPACRQLLHRAREKMARRRATPRRSAQRDLTTRFFGALVRGDVGAVVDLLVADVTATADHGGKAKAIQNVLVGPERVARYLTGMARKGAAFPGATMTPAWVNGEPAVILRARERIEAVYVFATAVVDGAPRIAGVHMIRNPDKLSLRAL